MRLTDEKIAELREAFMGEMRLMLPSTALSLLDEVTRSRTLLKQIEWAGAGQGLVYRSCPSCGTEWVYGRDDTHKMSCKLAPLIGKP